jgi:sigma-54 dependent transcriptional regulator, acetoin dehydrogenase operon transcriptional activator AcoR
MPLPVTLESTLEASRRYRSIGAIDEVLLRPHVRSAWERSHLGGADSRRPRAETLNAIDTERLRERHGKLIHTAHPYMQALSRASGGERHAVMLGDERAIVLDVLGDEQSIHGAERVPGPGALLDESACGANGMGTPLAYGGYVELVGPEHFIEGFHPFTCQGIPLRDASGEVAGLLSVSVRRSRVGQRLREIMICTAHAIETEFMADHLEEQLQRMLAAQGSTASEAERLLRDILQMQAVTRLRLEIAAGEFAKNRLTDARDLLALATTALGSFRRQAALWGELALNTTAPLALVDVNALLRDIKELLEGEAVAADVEVVFQEFDAVVVEADPHTLARMLFRALLNAIPSARGGVLCVGLIRKATGGELYLTPAAGPGVRVVRGMGGLRPILIPAVASRV